MEKEQLNAADCLMVGDREHDIFGARQNGIETIAVEYGYGSDQELTEATDNPSAYLSHHMYQSRPDTLFLPAQRVYQ